MRGDLRTVAPLFDSVSTFDFSGVAPELNLDGVLTARGVITDLPASGVSEVGVAVSIYPGLRELLETDPDFLENLSSFELDDLAFDFYVAASATPMTSAQYVDYQSSEAARLREQILADDQAPASLRAIAGDGETFQTLYLEALAETGLLRDEDVPPVATGRSFDVNAFFVSVGGLLGGETGAGIIEQSAAALASANESLGDLISKLRQYYGHTPDVTSGGSVPDRDEYDMGAANPTSFVAFELRAGPPDLFQAGEVVEDIVFDTEGIGQVVGDTVAIEGPSGVGEVNYVPIATPLPYTIRATYDSDAIDAAREIRVIVPLDDSLDERSFQLANLQLGSKSIALPPGRPTFVGEFDFFESDGYVLQVTAGVDATTRTASYLLRAIDPRDGLPPIDPAVGLLQPGETASVGFFVNAGTTAAVGTGGELNTGDAIELAARVVIDGQAAVDSEVTFATLDAIAPASSLSVTPLGNDQYNIQWSATDDLGGSGVVAYSLLVSLDGGHRYRNVLYRTTETTHVYRADPGQTPLFLVRSIDAAGNVEPVPEGIRVPRLQPGNQSRPSAGGQRRGGSGDSPSGVVRRYDRRPAVRRECVRDPLAKQRVPPESICTRHSTAGCGSVCHDRR